MMDMGQDKAQARTEDEVQPGAGVRAVRRGVADLTATWENSSALLSLIQTLGDELKARREFDKHKFLLMQIDEERSRTQLRELLELGRQAITDVVKPLTTAIGDGLRQRMASPVASRIAEPVVHAPIDLKVMTDAELESYRSRLTEIRKTLKERQRQYVDELRRRRVNRPASGPRDLTKAETKDAIEREVAKRTDAQLKGLAQSVRASIPSKPRKGM